MTSHGAEANDTKPTGAELTSTGIGIRRTAEMCAVFMIGDGLLGLLQPQRHVDLWRTPVRPVDLLVRPFSHRPELRRGYGLLQIAAGLALAARLKPRR